MADDDLIRTSDPAEVERLRALGYVLVRRRFLLVADLDVFAGQAPPPPPAGYRVEPLAPDPEPLLEMHWLSYPPEHPDHVPEELDPDVARAFFTDLWDGVIVGPWLPEASFAVLTGAGEGPVGAITVNTMADPGGPFEGPWVSDVQVHPAHRRRGLAELLFRHAIAALRRHGHRELGLAVTDGVDAERLYRRLGFTDIAPPSWQLRPPA